MPNDSTISSSIPVEIIHINDKWLAIVEGERILLQHRVGYIHGTGQEVDLSQINNPGNESMRTVLQEYGSHRILIRSLILKDDGSVSCDPFGVSPGGLPEEPYDILAPASQSTGLFFKKMQRKFELDFADPEY